MSAYLDPNTTPAGDSEFSAGRLLVDELLDPDPNTSKEER